VDTSADPKHCGRCGNACADDQTCRAGTCVAKVTPTPDMAMSMPGPRCNMDPPAGAKLPPPLPRYSGGSCPTLMAGKNAITSQGHARSFLLAVPRDLRPDEKLPLLFLWHWLGGSADSFYRKGDIQAAVDTQRFLAIMPEAKSDMIFKWPFDIGVSSARMEEEFRFFDDMLTCAAQQFRVNVNCVSSAGVSAGALFTDQLAAGRGQYLASALSLSGGVGSFAKPFGNPSHKMPFLVLWGGPNDKCVGIIDFNKASKDLEDALVKGGHFMVECVHNCAHAEPPVDPVPGFSRYASLWQFVFDHPYWLGAGESPYKAGGLPSVYPSWCAIGKGMAKPRTGACPNPPGC
jgi:predicted esterase